MSDAEARGWGRGWPTSRVSDMVTLKVQGADFPGGVHEDIALLMSILLEESIRRDYIDLRDGWCWGYANRAIKTSSGGSTNVASNHSWGLAIDINAPRNPFGGTSHEIPIAMGELWQRFGFQWGGFYSGTKDWMHLEYLQTPADAKRHTELASKEFNMDERLDDYDKGFDAYRDKYKAAGGVDPGDPPAEKPAWFKKGWGAARFSGLNPKQGE